MPQDPETPSKPYIHVTLTSREADLIAWAMETMIMQNFVADDAIVVMKSIHQRLAKQLSKYSD